MPGSESGPDLNEFIEKGSEEERIAAAIDFRKLPRHVAIIMDGNGRWATLRNLPRVIGHRAGIDAVRDVVEASSRLGLQVLTLYAFSLENWKRPKNEVDTLMALLMEYVQLELPTLMKNDIRFRVIGRTEGLDSPVQQELDKAVAATGKNGGLLFNIALCYGGRAEIVDACQRLLDETVGEGRPVPRLDEELFASYLYTAGIPDPDLLIRTSGELRISNFLLWQIAYAEIWVTKTLWPDFRKKELLLAIRDYQKRERRYGGVDGTPDRKKTDPSRQTLSA
ncbi:MAG: isoprenyl transferase [Acidobacteria bacterium]|nr:isoprenyl transferase [Acidobacteriota bacterium]